MTDDALDAHTRDAQETYGAFGGHACGDCPNPIALLEWLTALAYEKRDTLGDETIYKSVHHPFLMSAGDMALYWFTFYHAKVSGDL